jgi:hypothetical protein
VICKLLGCGKTGKQPAQSPNNGNAVPRTFATTTTFYLVNGVVVSNSTGTASTQLPPLLSLNGVPVPPGSTIDGNVPGVTAPNPTIGIWDETNTYADANLDPTHPYISVFNYSVLTSTNLSGNWKELETVVGWVNNNKTVPLLSTITYTNGVAVATNWAKCYLNSGGQPTNIVVYGALPYLAGRVQYPKMRDSGPPGPGSGGGTGTNGVVIPATCQFYKLTCSTNAIKTSWP